MKVVLFANSDWYLYNFRRSLAAALCEAGYEVLLVSPPGPYGRKLLDLGYRWIPAPMERLSLNPRRECILLWWLYRLARREGVDLVHGFTIKCSVYGSLAAQLAGRRARVNAVTGMGYVFSSNDTKARLLRPVVRGLLRMALDGKRSRLILQNPDDVALFLRERLVGPEQIRLIPSSGVDCARFAPAQESGADQGAGVEVPPARYREAQPYRTDTARISTPDLRPSSGAIGFTHWHPTSFLAGSRDNGPAPVQVLLAARLLWDKGVAEFVDAGRRLRAQGVRVELLLAGEPDVGNPATVPLEQIRAWEAQGALRWLGQVEDMPALYRSVDIVALPSYREGLPKGLIEAAACGLPLVTTDVPGCHDVVTDGVEGFVVPVRNSEALAGAIRRLAEDSGLRKTMGVAARKKALECFDERIVVRDTLAVYEELLGR